MRASHHHGSRAGRPAAGSGRAGVTLVETLVATMIIALLAGALSGAGETVLSMMVEDDRSWTAAELGTALLDEIVALPFDDPQSANTKLEPEEGEWAIGGTRALFDDVDDYTVWTIKTPLEQKDGTAIDAPGYLRAVTVEYVEPDDFTRVSHVPTDYKRITVTVYYLESPVAAFVTVRAQGGRNVDVDG